MLSMISQNRSFLFFDFGRQMIMDLINTDSLNYILGKLPMFYRIVFAITCKSLRVKINQFISKALSTWIENLKLINNDNDDDIDNKLAISGLKIFFSLLDLSEKKMNRRYLRFYSDEEFEDVDCYTANYGHMIIDDSPRGIEIRYLNKINLDLSVVIRAMTTSYAESCSVFFIDELPSKLVIPHLSHLIEKRITVTARHLLYDSNEEKDYPEDN